MILENEFRKFKREKKLPQEKIQGEITSINNTNSEFKANRRRSRITMWVTIALLLIEVLKLLKQLKLF